MISFTQLNTYLTLEPHRTDDYNRYLPHNEELETIRIKIFKNLKSNLVETVLKQDDTFDYYFQMFQT